MEVGMMGGGPGPGPMMGKGVVMLARQNGGGLCWRSQEVRDDLVILRKGQEETRTPIHYSTPAATTVSTAPAIVLFTTKPNDTATHRTASIRRTTPHASHTPTKLFT